MDWRFCCLSFEVTQLGLVLVMWAHLEFEIKWISNINSMLKKTLAHTKLCWEVTLSFQNPNSYHVMFGGPTWQDFLINLSFDLYEMQGGDTCKRLKKKKKNELSRWSPWWGHFIQWQLKKEKKMPAALKKQKSSNEWHDLCVLLVGPTGAVWWMALGFLRQKQKINKRKYSTSSSRKG